MKERNYRDRFFEDSIDMDEKHGIQDKATSLRRTLRTFELRLKGFKTAKDGTKYVYTGEVLAGSTVIQKGVALLQSFTEDVNLITGKQDRTFSKQKYRLCTTFNTVLLNDGTCLAENYSTVMQMFMDTIQNVGDVILQSRDLLKPSFGDEGVRKINGELI